ncbi:CPBP family intramembrane glutamic endopeptidase [Pinirhizobacter soli]|uniref:CPBP family intramembrane glutamic endopeptidase n=1 Tax=Pinirhizobacter soli TaxID=2786953 RepID=UPI002029FC47|nr:type II CAAX endopeptidase family protein [Pinirhizobacter soli]
MSQQIVWPMETGSKGWLAPGKLLALRAIAWAVLLFALLFGFMLAAVLGASWLSLPNGWYTAFAIIVPLLAVLAYMGLVRLVEKRPATELGLRPTPWLELGTGTIAGVVFVGATLLLLLVLGLYHTGLGHPTGEAALRSLIFNTYISAVMEELAFRAALLRLLARAFGPITGLVVSSIAFGAAHLTHGSWAAAAEIAFNGGLVMGLAYMATGRLWMSIGLHLGWDFSEETIYGVNSGAGLLHSVPNPARDVLWTGGTYGPDGSIFAALVGALALVILYWVYRSRLLAARV